MAKMLRKAVKASFLDGLMSGLSLSSCRMTPKRKMTTVKPKKKAISAFKNYLRK